ncbi:hypothetical protein ACWDV4_00255 [Micromonospora sp. NPDC003197]
MRGPRFVGRAFATGAAGVALTGALVLPGAAAAAGNTFVEVTPNTVQAGERVSIRANCDDGNNRQGNVQSDAFGRVIVRPDNGFLTGAATVPSSRPPGQYGVNLTCQNGNTATTTLTVVNMSKPSQGPATGAGGSAGGLSPTVLAGGIAAVVLGAGLALFGLRRRRPELGP